MTSSQTEEKKEYVGFLNGSVAYTHRWSPKEAHCGGASFQREGEEFPKGRVEASPSHLRYDFLDPEH